MGREPLPFQLLFAFDRVKALAPKHPEWATKEPFASLLQGDMAKVLASGSKGVAEIMDVTHAAITTDEFAPIVEQWITTAKHPQTGRLYTDMIYQPMVELLTSPARQRIHDVHRVGRRDEFTAWLKAQVDLEFSRSK